MKTVELKVDDTTLAILRRQAAAVGKSVESYAADLIRERLSDAVQPSQPDIIGMCADEPEVVDQMLEAAMEWRHERNRALLDKSPSGDEAAA